MALSRLLAAPVFEGDPDKSRVARLLNRLLFATIATALAVGLVADELAVVRGVAGALGDHRPERVGQQDRSVEPQEVEPDPGSHHQRGGAEDEPGVHESLLAIGTGAPRQW